MMAGIYVVAGPARSGLGLREVGPFSVAACGELASEARRGDTVLVFEGILTGGRDPGLTDAEVALGAFERGGVPALTALDGFFRLAVVVPAKGRCVVVTDPLATRPVYLYRDGAAAAAPNPAFFARCGLPMTLDRQAVYQTFRVCHPLGARTLVREVARSRPLTAYELSADGTVRALGEPRVTKEPDPGLGVIEAARRMRDINAEVMDGILTHPRLRERPVHLPLTAGMDSRHLLGELLASGRPPASIRHVHIVRSEYEPVAAMARGLDLRLDAPGLEELDLTGLTRSWVRRTAGQVHFHQMYLMGVADPLPPGGAVGFDGYLMDFYFGFYRLPVSLERRRYTALMMRGLFSDHRELARACEDELAGERAVWDGPETFQVGGMDTFNRGPRYTGSVFPILPEGALYFAPGAHGRALEFFRTAPEAACDQKRARLRLLQSEYPDLAAYPSEYGFSYAERTAQGNPKKPVWPDALSFVRGLATLHRTDPAPETEHAWVRQIPFFRRVCIRVTRESALAADGHLPAAAVRGMWAIQRAGGFAAYPLMSLVTCEVAYRVLVRREDPERVADWLVGEDA